MERTNLFAEFFFRRFLRTFCPFFFVLFFSCGIDNFYYLDKPKLYGDIPFVSGNGILGDEIKNYFTCMTNEESGSGDNYLYFDSSSEFRFLGTAIYYRIYNSSSEMLSVENSMASRMDSSSSASSAADYLISAYGYKQLATSGGIVSPLIQSGSNPDNRFVYIRLTDWNDLQKASICVSDSRLVQYDDSCTLKVNGQTVYPRRENGKGFDFSESSLESPVPSSSDSDVSWSAGDSGDGSVMYVDMYAVSVGRDISYALTYSVPVFLGSIFIPVAE